ncbi:hypothetical protein RRF57_012551 [Xylaria bambusicola]|uniref:Uncharacterized protein n=1 Tax=Xylaria bambusicola TaxID=326684 RepID=A0AAN7V4B3_9PEZI
MAFVVRAIEILTIPAGGKYDSGTDATGAHLAREGCRVRSVAGRAVASHDAFAGFQTTMADICEIPCFLAECGISSKHSEALGKVTI